MDETFTVDVFYGITYTTRVPVPIPEIIASLQSLERLLKRTPPFIEKAYQGIKVVETTVFVAKIESGSLIQDFFVRYVFKGQDNADKAKEVYNTIMADNTVIRTVVAMGVGSFITFGAMKLLPQGSPTTQLTAYNNTLVNIGAEVGITGDDIVRILEAVSDKKSLAREVVDAVRPAKSDPEAEIVIADIEAVTIPSEAIAEVPSEYTPPEPTERQSHYENVELVIFASDRDRAEGGWAGIAPGVVDRRTLFTLGQEVRPEALHGRLRVRANIIVHERYVPSTKKYVANRIEVLGTN